MSDQIEVTRHHYDQFGPVELSRITTKLSEESGEVCSAVIRHLERRDGRSWEAEIEQEVGDVLIVLFAICGRIGVDLDAVKEKAVRGFLNRTWEIEKCPDID